jgi:ribosomal protein S25
LENGFQDYLVEKNKEKEGKENNKEGTSVADIFRKESINSLFYGISDFVSKGWNWVSNLWKPSEENKAVQAEKYVEPSQVSLVEAISGKADTDTILANRLTPLEVVLQAMDDKLKTFLSILQTNQETRIDQKRQENEPINIILQINQNHLDGVMGDINNVTMLSPSSRFRLVG